MRRLKNKYRFVILNDKNFEEKGSFSFKGHNVLTFFSIFFVVMFVFIFLLIVFTPLKTYIPGYGDIETRKKINKLDYRADSLEQVLSRQKSYISNVKSILTGNIAPDTGNIENIDQKQEMDRKDLVVDTTSQVDTLLASNSGNRDPFSALFERNVSGKKDVSDYAFFTPLKGIVTEKYERSKGHYAVDIVGPSDVGIKAALDGVVVFAEWSASTGHVIILQHANNLVSVYKHNSELLKKVGNFVEAGEVISIIGETGELSRGPHLHFELWYDGEPVDPEKYIAF